MVSRAHLAFTVATVLSAALVVASVVLHFTTEVPEPVPVLRLAQGPAGDLLTGPIYIVAGLIAWRRRPENRIGPMMVVLGDTIVLPWVIGAAGTLGFTLAAVVDDVSPVIGLLVFLSFPTGRLEHRPERIVGGVGVATFGVLAVAELLFREQVAAGCGGCPPNVALVPNAAAADAVVTVVHVVAVLVVCGMVAVLAHAVARSDAPRASRPCPGAVDEPRGRARVRAHLRARSARAAVGRRVRRGGRRRHSRWRSSSACCARAFTGPSVSDLVRRARQRALARQLRDALARALGDPSLELLLLAAGRRPLRRRRTATRRGRPSALAARRR